MSTATVRERILASGLDLFHAHGFHGTSVNDITQAAGVPKGSFYNHFASKEALAVAAVTKYAFEAPLPLLTDPSVGGPAARITAHFEALRETFVASGRTRGCLMGNLSAEIADHSPSARETLTVIFDGWTEILAGVLEEIRAGGQPLPDEPQVLAEVLVNAWEGALLRARATQTDQPLDAFFGTVLGRLVLSCR
ncbi:TetR/AcrR family transcriptional regulator [Nocardioides sp.]|uniref:TetR/AcrR family transcriptional regulator n=1 Tax=Nocardioides sp. TaxID=35761 RepID=UPI001993D5D3|nr:TetR/AcrR family transcriptional regulator [Nocardioides sp.]MBC7277194.1 TetR family transcriptional regulator C-terminal domain-containing protein [Nocardioides sp.]